MGFGKIVIISSITFVIIIGIFIVISILSGPGEQFLDAGDVTDCNYKNSVVFESDILIEDNCVIKGDLTIRNNAVVEINYDSSKKSDFIVYVVANIQK